ncbi:C39 family peptidase [Edaphobacter bradus]|uniref:C39 family peptidase n=1 Tax=Edaphobacter bradus TaxID=2259016 RepID=UPI0021E05727|nr:C39 family peptidase [Edaphobacter bradus]
MPRSIFRFVVLMLLLRGVLFAAELSGIWLDIPFVKQEKNGCGPATIAMVMQYWQQQQAQPASTSADSDHILHTLRADSTRDIYASEMERYFQQNGYRTFAFSGQWADLKQQLGKGRPLIAALKPGSSRELHYVVVAGVDEEHKLVLLNDAAQRKLLKEDKSRFEQEWKATGYWTLLVVPEMSSH